MVTLVEARNWLIGSRWAENCAAGSMAQMFQTGRSDDR
jgi:hypothetical protein